MSSPFGDTPVQRFSEISKLQPLSVQAPESEMLLQLKKAIIQMREMLESEQQIKAALIQKLQSFHQEKLTLISERDHAVNKLLIFLNKDAIVDKDDLLND